MGDTDRKRRPNFRRTLVTDMAVYTTGPDAVRNKNLGGGSTTFKQHYTIKTDHSELFIHSGLLRKALELRQSCRS